MVAQSIELMISRPRVSAIVNIHEGEFDIIEIEANRTELIGKMGMQKENTIPQSLHMMENFLSTKTKKSKKMTYY